MCVFSALKRVMPSTGVRYPVVFGKAAVEDCLREA